MAAETLDVTRGRIDCFYASPQRGATIQHGEERGGGYMRAKCALVVAPKSFVPYSELV
jgi:hypothetical protein